MSTKTDVAAVAGKVIANIEKVIIGKRPQLTLCLVAYLCEGHILLEDVPGVAKTMLARALARSVGCTFKRLQCTPDLLPTDVTGVSIFNQKTAEFEFRPGPVFAQTLLADEINRATPRTQAALLEAMAERRVSVDGQTYTLKPPFLVIATQNPIDHEGTFPLPEAQLDRFLDPPQPRLPDAGGGGEDAGAAAAGPPDRRPAAGGRRPTDVVACQEAVRDDPRRRQGASSTSWRSSTRTRDARRRAARRQPAGVDRAVPHGPGAGGDQRPRLRPARRREADGAAGAGAPADPAAGEPAAQGDDGGAAARDRQRRARAGAGGAAAKDHFDD